MAVLGETAPVYDPKSMDYSLLPLRDSVVDHVLRDALGRRADVQDLVVDGHTLVWFATRAAARTLRGEGQSWTAMARRALDSATSVDPRDHERAVSLVDACERAATDPEVRNLGEDGLGPVGDAGYLIIEVEDQPSLMSLWVPPPGQGLVRSAIRVRDALLEAGLLVRDPEASESEIPNVWFESTAQEAGLERVQEVVTCRAARPDVSDPETQLLILFLGDAHDPQLAGELSTSVRTNHGSRYAAARSVGSTLILVVGGSFQVGLEGIETPESVRAIADLSATALET